ncbi:MAG: DUF1592 domain-containing protein [Nannocystaceae bacterium]|nr:DUF1592 domain-containing protein [Nannocystaceae bacterium]
MVRRTGTTIGLLATMAAGGCYQGAAGGGEDTDSSGGTETGSGDTEGDGSSGGSAESGEAFGCDDSVWSDSLSMRRLSRVQYRNTVESLVTWAAGAGAPDVLGAVTPMFDRVPEDVPQSVHGPRGGFRRLDQDVHQAHIDASYDVALAAATRLTEDHLESLAGACAVDGDPSNDNACVDDFIRRFGDRALRRPLTDEERDFYRDVYDADGLTQGADPEAFADVVVVMMTAPSFLYLLEHGEGELGDAAGVYRLSPYELAQRLSYQFWQAPPDEVLLAAAASGELSTDEGYEAQVDRVLADPRSESAVREFFDEWLWLEELSPIDARVGTPVFDAFLDGFEVTPETTQNMVDEVLDAAAYYASVGGTFEEFFLSDRSFATTADLAEIYGVPIWEGGDPPMFPQAARGSLLGRAAFVATGSPNTRPIMKGVRVREAMLCDQLQPPPDNAAGNPPDLSPESTTREVVEMLTEQAGTSCAGCHLTQINPLGYVTESFDALGRFRSHQVLFDGEGNVTGMREVDTTSTPLLTPGDDRQASSAADLGAMMLDTERVQACFARNYVRWTFGRAEDDVADSCMLQDTTDALLEGASLQDVLRGIALRDEFKTRKIEGVSE